MSASTTPSTELRISELTVIVLAGLFTAALCMKLLPEWRENPDLSHGFFAPVMFWLLIQEGRRRPERYLTDNLWLRVIRTGALVGGLACVAISGLYAAAVEWGHTLVGFTLAFALSGLLLAALLWLSTARVRVLPFNWSTFVAVALWPMCAALPPGTYARLTLQLQSWVTHIVLDSLHLLGIAASTSGNIIQLAHTSVGVEEACSGVRSLLSCIVAAVFFSATLVRRPSARVLLILLAPLLAFVMNIIRSLGLTLLANAGVNITGAIHDFTGYAILGVTAVMLGALALSLGKAGAASPAVLPPPPPPARISQPWAILSGYALTCVLLVFFVVNTRPPSPTPRPIPDLAAMLPTSPPGWDLVRTDDLYQFTSILETEHLAQRTYVRRRIDSEDGSPLQITVYIAYWSPGQAPVSLVAAHTPDACWPAGGWTQHAVPPPSSPFKIGRRPLPLPETRAFTYTDRLQNVWYWHLYDGRSITQGDPRSAVTLLKLAWHYGFRTAGEQLFVRISSNRPWPEIQNDPLLVGIVGQLRPYGL